MTDEEKRKVILELAGTSGKVEIPVSKYDRGTQTYYANSELAREKILQPVMTVEEKEESYDEIIQKFTKRLREL